MTLTATIVRSAVIGLALIPTSLPAATPQDLLPPGVYVAGRDLALATAGRYEADVAHTSVIARVSHIGYSYSVFRFGQASATLTWDPASPESSKLTASVDTASIETPVEGFARELAGEKFLNSAAHPKATFVSTAFRRVDATHGKVEGDFTLLGKTRRVTFDVALVGAGKGFGASPRLGVEARAWVNPQDYGLPAVFADPIEIVIDAEFAKAV